MSNYETAIKVIHETIEGLQESGVVDLETPFSEDLVILGSKSEFDSLGFVTFISDLEERVSVVADKDIFLVLDDIGEFNMNNPSLTIKTLAFYVAGLLGE